jgi:hypothetical protein
MFNLHANYYINKPNVPHFFLLFQCDICACFIQQRRMICGEVVDNETIISSSMVLSCSLFQVFISISVKNPSSHKYVIENSHKTLTAISEITGYSFFTDTVPS